MTVTVAVTVILTGGGVEVTVLPGSVVVMVRVDPGAVTVTVCGGEGVGVNVAVGEGEGEGVGAGVGVRLAVTVGVAVGNPLEDATGFGLSAETTPAPITAAPAPTIARRIRRSRGLIDRSAAFRRAGRTSR